MLQDQFVTGYAPFRNKKEKDQIWRELRKEFGERVRLRTEDNFVVYRYKEIAS